MVKFYPLFSQGELLRYSKNIEVTEEDQSIARSWYNRIKNQELLGELQNYLDFYDDILRKLLSYESSDRQFERRTRGGKRVEFCIVDASKTPILLFELKGQKTKLDVRPRNKSLSPIDQAQQYAYQLGGTWFVVSNYVDFWLFNFHKPQRCHKMCFLDFFDEEGNAKVEKIREFKFLLSKDQVLIKKSLKFLNNRTEIYERQFTNNFYKLYHETRLMLIQEFQSNNNLTKDEALHYAQIILNRILFILFAEDDTRELLKRQILENAILNPIKNAEVRKNQNRIWENILNLFSDINEGNRYRDIHAYDGELFSEDVSSLIVRDLLEDATLYQNIRLNHGQQLDLGSDSKYVKIFGTVVIDAIRQYQENLNPIFINFLIMASYDFSDQITVEIMGHIFELSLTDLEKFTSIEESRNNTAKRHADGIFYTPEFITDYIVKKAIIYYLREQLTTETFDQLIEENKDKINDLEYRIKKLKIVDPACGSGAFLIKAVDLLTELYKKIHFYKVASREYDFTTTSRSREQSVISLDQFFDEIDVRRQIVLDSIYGIDKNPESVEITKLSLFLKIAKKDVQFPFLGEHIKTGDSIILDRSFTSNSFQWKDEFPEIFQDGGFDIIIGNPPWGADLSSYRGYLTSEYTSIAQGQFDSFAIFLYHNLRDLLREGGVLGYIIPNEICLEDVNETLRKELLKYNLLELLNLGLDIFENVTKPSLILLIKSTKESNAVKILVGLQKEDKENLKTKETSIDTLFKRNGYLRNQSTFLTNERCRYDIWATKEDKEILTIIERCNFRKFKAYVTNGRGIDTNKQGKYLICPKCTYLNPPFGVGKAGRIDEKTCVNDSCDFIFKRNEEDDYEKEFIFDESEFGTKEEFNFPGYIGSDLYKFHFKRKPRSFKYLGDKIDDPSYQRYSKISWKDPSIYEGEKILIRKVSTGNLPEVMIHSGLLVFNQQI
ncbi:MAG: Eco57I restriction-modification methylase domain-containing protein, partial [Candidatus Hodarchaeales archaeon]